MHFDTFWICAIAGIALGAFFISRMKLGSLFKSPEVIHLAKAPAAKWKDAESAEKTHQQLISRGFTALGIFTIHQMPGLILRGYIDSTQQTTAVYYEHPIAGRWVDLVKYFADGGSVTVSSAKMGHEMDHRPGHDKVYGAEQDVEGLWRLLTEYKIDREPVAAPADAASFVQKFETAYAEDMAWRKSRGGPTEEEIRRVAASSGIEATDEMIQETRRRMSK